MSEAPIVRCRIPRCQDVMKPIFQSGFGYFADLYLVTCENPRCPMYGQTVAAKDYAELDLSIYLKPRKARV
jgi:hypothetical protein